MRRLVVLALLMLSSACASSTRGLAGYNGYAGAGPARVRVAEVRVSGGVSEFATVTVNGAADRDGLADLTWVGGVGVAPGGLPAAFAADLTGTATVGVEVRARDDAGNASVRRYRIRLSAE